MNVANIRQSSERFHLLETTGRSQTATMILQPGEASSEKAETHPHSDQILLLLDGIILSEVNGEWGVLRKDDSLIVPAGVPHRFINESSEPALAFTVYGPPAYQTEDPT